MGLLKKFQPFDAFQIFRLVMFNLHLTQLAWRRDVLALFTCNYFRTMLNGQSPVSHLGCGAVVIALALAQSQPLETMRFSG